MVGMKERDELPKSVTLREGGRGVGGEGGVWHAFVKAVLRGASFTKTIRVVQFEDIREIYQQMMQRALPNTEIIGQLMAEGVCYGHGAVDSDDDYGDGDAGDY